MLTSQSEVLPGAILVIYELFTVLSSIHLGAIWDSQVFLIQLESHCHVPCNLWKLYFGLI